MKAAEALPGIIGAIISWILNRATEVVGCLSQNLWALIVGIVRIWLPKSKNRIMTHRNIIQCLK